MALSDQEIKYLLAKAESSKNDRHVLIILNKIINNTPPHPYYFSMRSVVYQLLGQLERAIEDINKAIELDPDQGGNYCVRASILLAKLEAMGFHAEGTKLLKDKIIRDYKAALEKNPLQPNTWLSLIEFNIIIQDWDSAIGIFGECKPYIITKEDQLLRSWLGCTALALSGDPVQQEDKAALYDSTIRIPHPRNLSLLAVDRITSSSFLSQITRRQDWTERNQRDFIEIQKQLLEHFDDWRHRGAIMERLGCFEEAIEAYERAIQFVYSKNRLATALLLQKKSVILERLGRKEDARKTYRTAMAVAPWHRKLVFKIEPFLKKGAARNYYGRARAYSPKGDKQNALSYLSKAVELNAAYKKISMKDESFKDLWDDEDFKKIIA